MTVDDEYWALRRGDGLAVLDREVIRVTGPDAVSFLQGQLSQDISALAVGEGARSFLLEPNGKVLAWARVTRAADDELLLDVRAGFGASVVQRLNRFKLRTKAEIELVEGWTCAVHPMGTEPRQLMIEHPGHLLSSVDDGVTYYLSDDPSFVVRGVSSVGPSAYEAWRIDRGIPELGTELIPTETIPGEAGSWAIDRGVSFTKGCYTGQELVARIDSRGGNVPRPVRRLVIDAPREAMPRVGDEVALGDKVVGSLTSVAWSPEAAAPVALAPLARSVELDTAVEVRCATGTVAARVEAPPPR